MQITGGAGLGKTWLVEGLLAQARARSFLTLTGRASEPESGRPYDIFVDAVETALGQVDPQTLDGLGPEARTALRAIVTLPGTTEHAGPVAVYRLSRAVRELLQALSSARPVVLALDDVHWADHDSLALLGYLLRHPPETRVLLVLSHRVPGLPLEVEAALAEARVQSIDLQPFSFEEARVALGVGVDEEAARRLWYDSGGNPLYLRELARAPIRAQNVDAPAVSVAPGVPSVVATTVAYELADLQASSPTAVRLLHAGAVLDDGFDFRVAAHLAGLDEAEGLDGLDELVGRDIVRLDEGTGLFRFRHPVVLRAIYHSVGQGRRLSLHARAAEILGRRGAPASARAPHVERSATVGDREAAQLLADVGITEAITAPASAAHWLSAALRLLPAGPEHEPRRRAWLFVLAVAQASHGELDDSRVRFVELLTALSEQPTSGDAELRAPAVLGAALVEHLRGRHDDGQALMLSTLERHGDESAANLLRFGLAAGCYFDADWQGMREWAQSALEADPHDTLFAAMGEGTLALAAYGLGDVPGAIKHTDEAARRVDALSSLELARHLDGIAWLGWAEFCLGRWHDAYRHADRAVAISRDTGQQHLESPMLIISAMARLAEGRLDLAADDADAAYAAAEHTNNALFQTWALTLQCMIELHRGDPNQAVELGQRAVTTARESYSSWANVAGCYLAEAYLEAGDPDQARRQLLGAGEEPEPTPLPFYRVHVCAILAAAAVAVDDVDDALRWARRGREQALALEGLDMPRAQAERVLGQVKLAAQDIDGALQCGELALAAAGRGGQPLEAARAHLVLAGGKERLGDQASVSGHLAEARAFFAAAGAPRHARCLDAYPGAPLLGPLARRGVLDALTQRERQVAELVAADLTNRQVAVQLGLSIKSIEANLARVFAKIGASSREQVKQSVLRARAAGERQ